MGNEKKRKEEQFVGQLAASLASASGVELTNAIHLLSEHLLLLETSH